MNSKDELHVAVVEDMIMEVYDGPPPSWKYVCFHEQTLLKTREALAKALHDRAHAERRALASMSLVLRNA